MPIYEFACQDCGHEFEKIQSFSDSSTPACPNCQGVHVQRRLSAPAIHFKGSGWYITDSKSAAKGSATGSSAGGEESKGESKGDGSPKDGAKESAKDGVKDGAKTEAGKAEASRSESGKSATSSAPAAGKPE
jgi:putative FmdB family regulatory protein